MGATVSFEDVKISDEITIYIRQADASLKAWGYTEHSFTHVTKCADFASKLLLTLGYSEREADLARIAGYMHDIGNVVNRTNHAQTGAIMAFRILDHMGMDAEDIAAVMSAIGNHDEGSGYPVSAITAALILADKTDVRRSRVRTPDSNTFDIHDRVNYAVYNSSVEIGEKTVTLIINIDTTICAVMDYFEIFLNRMLLCRRAAEFFRHAIQTEHQRARTALIFGRFDRKSIILRKNATYLREEGL